MKSVNLNLRSLDVALPVFYYKCMFTHAKNVFDGTDLVDTDSDGLSAACGVTDQPAGCGIGNQSLVVLIDSGTNDLRSPISTCN